MRTSDREQVSERASDIVSERENKEKVNRTYVLQIKFNMSDATADTTKQCMRTCEPFDRIWKIILTGGNKIRAVEPEDHNFFHNILRMYPGLLVNVRN